VLVVIGNTPNQLTRLGEQVFVDVVPEFAVVGVTVGFVDHFQGYCRGIIPEPRDVPRPFGRTAVAPGVVDHGNPAMRLNMGDAILQGAAVIGKIEEGIHVVRAGILVPFDGQHIVVIVGPRPGGVVVICQGKDFIPLAPILIDYRRRTLAPITVGSVGVVVGLVLAPGGPMDIGIRIQRNRNSQRSGAGFMICPNGLVLLIRPRHGTSYGQG
jgi:hypothetical protein